MKNKTLGIFALLTIGVLGLASFATAFPFQGMFRGVNLTDDEVSEMTADHTAMQEAIENKDFATWKSLMQKQIARMQESLTEENFNGITQMHEQREEFRLTMQEARKSGDYSKVEELQEKYGFEKPMARKMHQRQFE